MNYCRDTTSGEEGLALIAALREAQPNLPTIAMTAWASIDLAVEAMRRGAVDFIEKPWQNARVLSVLESRVSLAERDRQVSQLSEAQSLRLQEAGEDFVVESAAMRKAVEELMRIADSDANILLLGENGTGKSHIAQLLHRWSPRRSHNDNLFVPFFTTKLGGSGIGLVLSRQIVESQSGTLSLIRRPEGTGTIAQVRLPLLHCMRGPGTSDADG